jgi:PAS domain S-box-containing protein
LIRTSAETKLPCGCAAPARAGWAGLVDPTSDLLLTVDGAFRIVAGFPHESELLRGALCKASALDEVFEANLARLLRDRIQVVLQTGEPSNIEVRIGRHDGTSLPARVRLSPDEAGVLLLARMASPQPRVDPRAPSDDASFWMLFDAAPIPIAVEVATDANGEGISRLNRKFTAVFGYDAHDVPGVQHWWPLAYPDPVYREQVRQDWFRRVREAGTRGEAPKMETKVVCKDGTQREIEFGLSVIGDRHVVTFVDLTEERRSQRALATRVEELRVALEEITRLRKLLPVCAWCHKLRNDDGYWLAVDEFLAQSSEVTLTHGICPECRSRHLGR